MLRAKRGSTNRFPAGVGSLVFAGLLLAVLLGVDGWMAPGRAFAQVVPPAQKVAGDDSDVGADPRAGAAESADPAAGEDRLSAWEGKPVLRITFEGVPVDRLAPLQDQLAQQPHAPLLRAGIGASLRRLYATGLYDSIAADGTLEDSGVALTFRGVPRTFIGVVSVSGAQGANTNSLLVRVSRLTPGARFTASSLDRAEASMRHSLAGSGYYQPVFTYTLNAHPRDQLVDIAFTVDSGPHSRIGSVEVTGDSGLTEPEFRHYSKLKKGQKVDQQTTGKALDGVENYYRKEQRLEAEVKLGSKDYVAATNAVDFQFSANRGPAVHVIVDGVSLSEAKIRKLLPIYEEGSVDEDLLNEGNRRLVNYYQRLGYFDVKARHELKPPSADLVEIVFHVDLGTRHRVGSVTIAGRKYFDLPTLQERLSVRAHDAFDRQGVYNQSLVSADVASLEAIYQNNGFSHVKVTPEIQDTEVVTPVSGAPARSRVKPMDLKVIYHIEEGEQQRVHSVQLEGADKIMTEKLAPLLNTAAGQPFSPQSLAGDREAILTYYLSQGFDQVQVDVMQSESSVNPANQGKEGNNQVDITFRIREGEQVLLRRLLITGLHYTRPQTIAHAITIKEGQPLDQTALLDTQRNLYGAAADHRSAALGRQLRRRI